MTSKIKVDNINKVSDDSNIISKCGTTVTVGAASDGVRTGADNLQAADGGNLISQSGTTITLGASGDTITLASGASQTGFGRTGTVDWQTAIKTSTITAVNGEGYFVNTTGGAITANLPAGVVGAIVSFKDYAQTFDTNALTIVANGSEKIEGLTSDLILDTEGLATTLVYGDATKGWQAVNSNEVKNIVKYVAASGGNSTATCGDFKIHTFTGPGTFTVTCAGNSGGSNSVDYLVVAGGGGGGGNNGYGAGGRGAGGAGAGGVRLAATTFTNGGPSAPRSACVSALPVTATGFPITVGAAGAGGNATDGGQGSNSSFSTITSAGGGKGAGHCATFHGVPGGSGGGGANVSTAGNGNTPPVAPPQGMPSGTGGASNNNFAGGGGGGFMAAGGNGNPTGNGGSGGAGGGWPSAFGTNGQSSGGQYYMAGGGGGGVGCQTGGGGAGGIGGEGGGANSPPYTAGNANYFGGGGGGAGHAPGSTSTGGNGSAGIVIIRYKFQN